MILINNNNNNGRSSSSSSSSSSSRIIRLLLLLLIIIIVLLSWSPLTSIMAQQATTTTETFAAAAANSLLLKKRTTTTSTTTNDRTTTTTAINESRRSNHRGRRHPPTRPMPTRSQLRYSEHEIVALIHFNMGTFIGNGDPSCTTENWLRLSHNPATFHPHLLDTDQWATILQRLGAKHAVLTAKHGCGFLLWPSKVPIRDATTSETLPQYPYGVKTPNATIQYDIVQRFVDSFRRVGLGVGFYYSLKNNFLVNMKDHKFVPNRPLLPYQINMTLGDYEEMALGHLQELWTRYGPLTEHWFDSGYTDRIKNRLARLLQQTQPNMAVWRGQGITKSAIAWDGTESGHPAGSDLWSTGCDYATKHTGDPTSNEWCPKGCDTTLQNDDIWFYEPTATIRSLPTLIDIYHKTVGRNGVLELDVAIDRSGQIQQNHALRYQEMGDYIQACYGSPKFVRRNVSGYLLEFDFKPQRMDRLWLREDQWHGGQRIRQYKVYVKEATTDAAAAAATDATTSARRKDDDYDDWILFSQGHSVGNKRIDINNNHDRGKKEWFITALRIHVEIATDTPIFREIAIFEPCPDPKDFAVVDSPVVSSSIK